MLIIRGAWNPDALVSCCCYNRSPLITSDLKQHRSVILQCLEVRCPDRLPGLTSACGQASVPSRRLQGKILSLPLPAFRGPCVPWPMAPSSILKAGGVRLSVSPAAVSLVLSSLPAFFTHDCLVIALAQADNPSPHLQVS